MLVTRLLIRFAKSPSISDDRSKRNASALKLFWTFPDILVLLRIILCEWIKTNVPFSYQCLMPELLLQSCLYPDRLATKEKSTQHKSSHTLSQTNTDLWKCPGKRYVLKFQLYQEWAPGFQFLPVFLNSSPSKHWKKKRVRYEMQKINNGVNVAVVSCKCLHASFLNRAKLICLNILTKILILT